MVTVQSGGRPCCVSSSSFSSPASACGCRRGSCTGVGFSDSGSLLLAAILLGLANAVVRPILTILTFPLTILTFGLFLLVVNAAMIGLVAMLLGGFVVDGLMAGIGAAIVTGVVSWIAGWFIGERPQARRLSRHRPCGTATAPRSWRAISASTAGRSPSR